MQIELTEEADEFIRRAIEGGRHRRPEDAVREALELWIERERRREELLAALDQAEASVARGEGITLTKESMRELVADVKRRGRERIAAKKRARG
jgi:putative addiction module CopG family antidote